MVDPELKKYLEEEEGYCQVREVPGQGVCGLHPFMFTWAIVVDINRSFYSHRFCYENLTSAYGAFVEWDGTGDPGGPGFVKRKPEL